MAVADPIAGVVAFLEADSAVTALVSTRVFGGELPAAEAESMPRAAIVVTPAGGGLIGRAYQSYGDTRVALTCYGANRRDSYQVYLAAAAALKQLRHAEHGDCLLMWARASAGGSTTTDPDTDWPVTLASWQVLASEQAVEATS